MGNWWWRYTLVLGAVAVNILGELGGFLHDPELTNSSITWHFAHASVGIVYAPCALIAWRYSRSKVPGWLMLAVSLSWNLVPLRLTILEFGGVWPWLSAFDLLWALLIFVLVLVYPTGRIANRFDLVLVIVGSVLFGIRIISTFLAYSPSRADCDCAPNVYAIFPDAASHAVIDGAFRLVGVSILVIVAITVTVRWFQGSTPARRVAFIMPLALLLLAATLSNDVIAYVFSLPRLPIVEYVSFASVAAVPVSFVSGLLYVRGLRTRVSDLVVVARDGADRLLWESSLISTLHDPALRVYWWDDETGGYLDSLGVPATPQVGGRSLLPIETDDGPLAIIEHDSVLAENTRLLDAVSAALRLSVDNDRLRSELEKTLEEVRESRLRIVTAEDAARKGIERDLHDGSQQLLVSLAITLRIAASKAESAGSGEVVTDLGRASAQLAAALKELRELARGIHPAVLTEGGLEPAISELAGRSPIPVDVVIALDDRLPTLVEATAYFVIGECLTNTAKYAEASVASVSIREAPDARGWVLVEVADNGRGGADASSGSGLRGLQDRVEAVGGHVAVDSPPDAGTRVTATLPR